MSEQENAYKAAQSLLGEMYEARRDYDAKSYQLELLQTQFDNQRLAIQGLAEALWSFISDADAQELHVGSLTSHQKDARAQARAALKNAAPFLKKETT